MNKCSKIQASIKIALVTCFTLFGTAVIAHDGGVNDAGTPVCLEANYMVADAMNAPFSSVPGPGRVIEQNIFTGERGITVTNPFSGANAGTAVCPGNGDLVQCPGPWKPTGTFSGGQKGHAYITSAGQQALTELHRDGTPIRTVSYRPLLGNPTGNAGRGSLPRPLGTQIMPNGNLVQAICDANFFNAQNSDPFNMGESAIDPATGISRPDNSSWMYFPPVYSTAERAANSRILVLDQDTLEVIDEYRAPKKGSLGANLWGCMAGISFTDEGMLLSFFHSGAVLVVDWRDGVDAASSGVGSNKPGAFKINRGSNRATVTRVIDFVGGAADNPARRDTLRANTLDEQGNVYATNRRRSEECLRGEAPGATPNTSGVVCNPGVFRQRVSIDIVYETGGATDEDATLALDPGINIIAGIRINRMSGPGCDYVQDEARDAGMDTTLREFIELCNVETLLVAASAVNPGCVNTGPVLPNPCFTPGGRVVEYRIDEDHLDGGSAWGGVACDADPNSSTAGVGCALPIAEFGGVAKGDDNLDPRMLMPIQRAFIQ